MYCGCVDRNRGSVVHTEVALPNVVLTSLDDEDLAAAPTSLLTLSPPVRKPPPPSFDKRGAVEAPAIGSPLTRTSEGLLVSDGVDPDAVADNVPLADRPASGVVVDDRELAYGVDSADDVVVKVDTAV